MKKVIAILGLLLLFLIQFGSVGFTVYKNECNKAKISTYTLETVGCCCSKNKSKTKTKSCCKTKKTCTKAKSKSCCSKKKSSETVNKKCCSSDLMFLKVLCESFNIESLDIALDNNINYQYVELPQFKIINTNLIGSLITENYNCNSPPLINYDKRIFIQSFQI